MDLTYIFHVPLDHKNFNFALLQRDAATAPNVGDRVPYVIIKAAKGAKVSFWCFFLREGGGELLYFIMVYKN